jgi:hypothetical protein
MKRAKQQGISDEEMMAGITEVDRKRHERIYRLAVKLIEQGQPERAKALIRKSPVIRKMSENITDRLNKR